MPEVGAAKGCSQFHPFGAPATTPRRRYLDAHHEPPLFHTPGPSTVQWPKRYRKRPRGRCHDLLVHYLPIAIGNGARGSVPNRLVRSRCLRDIGSPLWTGRRCRLASDHTQRQHTRSATNRDDSSSSRRPQLINWFGVALRSRDGAGVNLFNRRRASRTSTSQEAGEAADARSSEPNLQNVGIG